MGSAWLLRNRRTGRGARVTAKPAPPYALTPDDLDVIATNLALGLPYARAVGTPQAAARLRASMALEITDAKWHARVRAAEAAGEAARKAKESGNASGAVLGDLRGGAGGVPAAVGADAGAIASAGRLVLPDAGVAEAGNGGRAIGAGDIGGVRNGVVGGVVRDNGARDTLRGADGVRALPGYVEVADVSAPRHDVAAQPSKRASEATDDGQPDWEAFRREADSKHGPGRYGLYLLQEERIAKTSAGRMPATSLWWLKTFREFFESNLTWLLAMVGRGGGKSSNLERLFMVVALLTERVVPPGQPWTAPFMSVVEKDADRRIAELVTLLMLAYRIEVKARARSILAVKDACGNDIEIVSTAGTVGQTSGPTTVAVFLDEFSKVLTSGNLDSELIASLVGTSRDLVGWVGVRCSSAWETRGAHFASCMEGTNSENYVASIGVEFIDAALAGYEDVARWESAQGNSHAAAQIRAFAKTLHPGSPNIPTWVPRPTLSALASRMKLETLPKDDPGLEGLSRHEFWIREYGSMPLSREGGIDYAEQCYLAADISSRLAGRNSRRPSPQDGPLTHPSAPPGDPRYAGPPRGRGAPVVDWRKRKML